MLNVSVVLEDLTDDYDEVEITIPCNLHAVLNSGHEYGIVECDLPVSIWFGADLYRLNSTLDEINCENPEMTVEYLSILFEASDRKDFFDDNFLESIKSNDFMFEKITECSSKMEPEEIAALHLATKLKIPFDKGISREMLNLLESNIFAKYVRFEEVWRQYEQIGFRFVEDLESAEYAIYVIQWR